MKEPFLQINIPSPCHEDWNKMSPRDKGAFCESCEKTVVDLSGMNDAELAKFVKDNGSNWCGRFRNTQLNRSISPSVNPDMSALKTFVIVLFLVFGGSLFSYSVISNNREKNNMARVPNLTANGSNRNEDHLEMTQGLPVCREIKEDVKKTKDKVEAGQRSVYGYAKMLKPSDASQIPADTGIDHEVVLSEVNVRGDVSGNSGYIMGMGVAYYCEIRNIFPDISDSAEKKNAIDYQAFDKISDPIMECFPNPAGSSAIIRYNIPKRMDVNIELYDLTGKKLMDMISAKALYEGTYIYSADFSGLPAGTYLCRMIAGEKTISSKLIIEK